jgi:hypothetical protein
VSASKIGMTSWINGTRLQEIFLVARRNTCVQGVKQIQNGDHPRRIMLTSSRENSCFNSVHSKSDSWNRWRRTPRGLLYSCMMTSSFNGSHSSNARPMSSAVLFQHVGMSHTMRAGGT